MRLNLKTALISGGASGIGKATAERFLSEGAKVAILGNDEREVMEVTKSLRNIYRDVLPLICDVSEEQSVREAVDKTADHFGKITTIVNNAGMMQNASIEEETTKSWDRHMNINVRGMMLICKHAFPYLKQQAGSSIVNVSSIMAYTSAPSSVSYSASKAAILGLTKAIAMDGAPYGIRANMVCPGTIDTPMYRRFIDRQADPDAVRQSFNRMFPLGRIGKPEDVAWLNVFLTSDESAYITGAEIVIDGGFMIKGTND